MINTEKIKEMFASGANDALLMEIYLDENRLDYQRKRYIDAISKYEELYGMDEISIYSAPGRSEICGNQVDHQNGEVIAASVNLDTLAIVKAIEEPVVKVVSGDAPLITVFLNDLEKQDAETGTTVSLIKGVLKGIENQGGKIGGFQAYITSDVLIGAGLSSSAAFEVMIGTIISGLYNDMQISPVDIAKIGQYAENVYFGKPCGLMDQMACSVGNLVHIDFAVKENPVIEAISCDLAEYGYSLCITDTKGSHADLTGDYAAVPAEMRQVAALFGKEILYGVTLEDLIEKSAEIREKLGDRPLLRAIHFVNENKRVRRSAEALKAKDFEVFLQGVKESGDSSFKFVQNVYTNRNVQEQNMSVALAFSESILGNNGVCRVHGGGFAGTIQAFVKNEAVADYKDVMDQVFGKGACTILKIRKYGGMKVL